jgi:hypothetical protein
MLCNDPYCSPHRFWFIFKYPLDLIWSSVLGYVCTITCGVVTVAVQGLFVCIASLRSPASHLNWKYVFLAIRSVVNLRTFPPKISSIAPVRLNLVLKCKSPSTIHLPNQIDPGLSSASSLSHHTLNSPSTNSHPPPPKCRSSHHEAESRLKGQPNNSSDDPFESAMQ